MVTAGEAGMDVASTFGVAGGAGVLVVAGADFDVAAASARAVATTGDSDETGAATADCVVAGADGVPFGVKVTSLALALMSTVESVAVAMSMRAFRHGIFFGYGTCFWRSSVPWMLYCHLTGITVRTAVMIGILRESPEALDDSSLWGVGAWEPASAVLLGEVPPLLREPVPEYARDASPPVCPEPALPELRPEREAPESERWKGVLR